MHSVLDAIITSNEQLGQRTEEFAQLLVEHDKTLDELLERIGRTVPEIRKELESKLTESVPGLVQDAYGKYNEDLEARCRAALAESQTKLEAVRGEIVALAAQQFTAAEKQIGLTAEQIEARILGTLTEAAKERITKLERGLVIEIQHAVNAALPKQELAAAPTFIDSYRGQWREGMVAQRGDLVSYYGSTYLALEDTNDTPGRKNINRDGAKWAVIAARGAGGGGGGGGDSLPSQTGNAGKFLKTDGTTTLWETIPGGGAPTDAEYIVGSANGSLSAERVISNSTSVTVNFATGGQVSLERAALTGDVTASQNSNATTIASSAVTNAKLANMTASTIKARITASTGAPEDATLTQVLDLVGSAAQGDILYRGASTWTRLGAGTSGQYLQTQGAAANPQWATVSGGGSAADDENNILANQIFS